MGLTRAGLSAIDHRWHPGGAHPGPASSRREHCTVLTFGPGCSVSHPPGPLFAIRTGYHRGQDGVKGQLLTLFLPHRRYTSPVPWTHLRNARQDRDLAETQQILRLAGAKAQPCPQVTSWPVNYNRGVPQTPGK